MEGDLTKKFEGKPCIRCGATTRSAVNKACLNCKRERNRNWWINHPEQRNRTNKSSIEWSQKNSDKHRERCRLWRENNRERYREIVKAGQIKNRMRRLLVEGSHTEKEFANLKHSYHDRCLCCGRHESESSINRRTGRPFVLEEDHVVPVSKGGSDWITNIQPLCHDCNGTGGKGTLINDFRRTLHPLAVDGVDYA